MRTTKKLWYVALFLKNSATFAWISVKDAELIDSNMGLVREARKKMMDWAKQNIPENDGIKYDIDADEFKELTVRRGDIKNITKHVHENASDAYLLCNQLNKVIENSEYIGWSNDENIIDSKGKKVQKHPNVDYWMYYRFKLRGKNSYINVFFDHQRKEYRVYCIRDSRFNTNIIQFPKGKK